MIVSGKELLLPVWMLPKLKLPGVALIAPGVAPVPDKPILSVGLEALLAMARLPVEAQAMVSNPNSRARVMATATTRSLNDSVG